ncbi:MAG TPA: hypothetical protein VFA33_01985 [Bryobacteraceae bacterium]|nr:hypothetical protein [Bryobacteraceae bacterium]
MPEELEPETEAVDPSHELDLVPIFSSSNVDAEMEAMAIHGILEANGIPAVVVGASTIPVLQFQVQVPRSRTAEAERAIAEAREAGPAAAAEAEEASEGTQQA